jgi:hypothetical protein
MYHRDLKSILFVDKYPTRENYQGGAILQRVIQKASTPAKKVVIGEVKRDRELLKAQDPY